MKGILAETKEFVLKGYEKLDLLEGRLAAIQGGKDASRHWSDTCPAFYEFAERANFLGFQRLQGLSRTVEYILKRLDNYQIHPQPHVIGHLFNLTEDLRRHLDQVAGSGAEANQGSLLPKDSPSAVAHKLVPFNPLPVFQKILVFRTPDDGRMAMPFDNVMRLESFQENPADKKESVGEAAYQDRRIPTIDVSRVLPERRIIFRRPPVRVPMGQTRQMIVYVTPFGEVGLVVDAILDVFKAKLEVERPASRRGVHGSMELKDRLTEILDIQAILSQSGLVFSQTGSGMPSERIAS